MASTESSPARLIALSLLLVSAGPSSGPAAEPRRVAPAPPPHRDHRPLAEADEFVATFDPWMAAAIERLEAVPAAALTVVVGDTVVLSKAWGVADVDTGALADEDTQFYIASMTKAFTGLMASILEARGEIDLGSTLASHLDGTTLDPAIRADEVLLRDFLTHTSGLANDPIGYRLAYTGEHDPATLWGLLAASTPAEGAPLGTYRYTNVGYNVLAMILDRETGKTWQDHLRDELFTPLGMARTTAYASLGRERGWTVAAPHFGLGPGGVRRLSLEKNDATMQSAGGLMCTARDMGRWLRFQLRQGALDGRQVVDSEVVAATQRRLVETPPRRDPPFPQDGYGLGWAHGEYDGHRVLMHGGGYPGFISFMSFMPEVDIGVGVMANEASIGGRLLPIVARTAYDWWLGEDVDLPYELDRLVAQRDAGAAQFAASLADRAERTWTLSRPREAYAGTFVSPRLGTLRVAADDGALRVTAGNLQSLAEPYPAPESMRVELIPLRGSVISFSPAEGPVERLVLDGDAYERAR